MSRFIRDLYKDFEAYTPGEQPKDMQYVKLNTNESPFPPAPEVIKALTETDMEKLRLYPDPTGSRLKDKIAALYGVKRENVYLSNGSDDILNFTFMAFNDPGDEIAMADITYSFYDVIAALHGIKPHIIPLADDMTIIPEDYIGLGMNMVIANPNAPTGLEMPQSSIEEIVKSNPDNVVLIDEAYVDFGAETAVPLIHEYDNVIISQTFSKSRSFAGGRLGFAIADASLIEDLCKMQYSTNPYNVNELSLILAEASIDADDYYKENSKYIQEVRAYTEQRLTELGFEVIPSKANFVFARHSEIPGEDIYLGLKDRGVLVRHFSSERIKDYCRITIGSREQMDVLFDKLEEMISA